MGENSIAGRTQRLRREIELIQQQEHLYRTHWGHSLAENEEHAKRNFEYFGSVKNSGRLSKEQSNDQATDQSGTVDFYVSRSATA